MASGRLLLTATDRLAPQAQGNLAHTPIGNCDPNSFGVQIPLEYHAEAAQGADVVLQRLDPDFSFLQVIMAKNHGARFVELVDAVRPGIQECTVQDVVRRRTAGDSFVLVDVREESEFNAARIPGAKHLGKGVIERDIEEAIPDPSTPIVLYCGGGYRSARAAYNLQQMGYTSVISMDGGFRGWKDSGLEVDSTPGRSPT